MLIAVIVLAVRLGHWKIRAKKAEGWVKAYETSNRRHRLGGKPLMDSLRESAGPTDAAPDPSDAE